MKPRTNDINQCMNNSSVLVAPSRSEIRISVTLPVVNFRKLASKVCHVAMASSAVRVAAVVASGAFSSICILELPASVSTVVFLGVTSVVASMFSFAGILNELGGFNGMLEEIKKED